MKPMMAGLAATALLLGACNSQEQTAVDDTSTSVAADSPQAVHRMSGNGDTAAHGARETATAGVHDAHAAADAPTGSDHGQHALASSGTEHAAHDAPDPSQAHAAHGAGSPPADEHAGHQPPADEADAAHALHAEPADAHARHEASAQGQEAHAAHAAVPRDTSHAAHVPVTDSAHAGHRAAPAMPRAGHAMSADTPHAMAHKMAMFDLGRTGWMAIGMAQVFPTFSMALPSEEGSPLSQTGFYATQPAIMLNLESPQSRVTFRTTLNFEGLTQPDGELTFGGWGEGFLDKRHPHTLVHEAMLSVNVWARDGAGFSLSAGKGFAPYGTDDPMARPVLKYPTNHHLSQILERFTLNGVYTSPRWSVEVGVFGGGEPTGPYDFSNAESFANSWSARVTRRFGAGAMGIWDWELSGSYGYVVEEHDGESAATQLYNTALRHERDHSFGRLYSLVEASLSDPEHHDGYFSILGEASLMRGPHNPYGRVEFATRPEYPREGLPGEDGFFRYDHDDDPIGSTRWVIVTAGYGYTLTGLPWSVRPYIEAQWNRVSANEGGIDPDDLFGRSSFVGLSLGARVFVGGEPMRMGSYGVLDSMTLMHRMQMGTADADAPAGAHTQH